VLNNEPALPYVKIHPLGTRTGVRRELPRLRQGLFFGGNGSERSTGCQGDKRVGRTEKGRKAVGEHGFSTGGWVVSRLEKRRRKGAKNLSRGEGSWRLAAVVPAVPFQNMATQGRPVRRRWTRSGVMRGRVRAKEGDERPIAQAQTSGAGHRKGRDAGGLAAEREGPRRNRSWYSSVEEKENS